MRTRFGELIEPGSKSKPGSVLLPSSGEEHLRQHLGVEPCLLGRRQALDAVDAAVVEVHELSAEALLVAER